jgi:hypothetical protein
MEMFKSSIHNYEETVERPVYGYLLHNDEQRLEILEKNPSMPAKELSITITNSWKNLSEVFIFYIVYILLRVYPDINLFY